MLQHLNQTYKILSQLSQHCVAKCVNSLGLSTSEEKLKVVCLLKYPETLGALKYYLDLIGYLKSYIHYYAQLVSLLQALKTSLPKRAPESG